MAVPILKSGFCGCTLKANAIVISLYYLVSTTFTLVSTSYMGVRNVHKLSGEQADETARTAQEAAEVMVFTILATFLILNVIMLVGIHKESYCLIIPYLCFKGIIWSIMLLSLIYVICIGYFVKSPFIATLFIFWESYGLFVIYSYYRELKDRHTLNTVCDRQNIVITEDSYNKGNFA